ncbi:MAG: S-layer homology domain-containing protein, partial [Clostridiales bacterium]|nr:S-layer homology domain-containing protein [Clostridiales bacterium]
MFKRFASAFLAICLITSILPGAFASDIGSHWAKNDILLLSKKGIMTGDGKGNYRPDAKITRAEFAALLNRTFGYLKEGDIRFSDVTYNNDWKSQAITRAATFGYMLGSDGKANPNGMISRQEASAMLVRILRLPIKETGSTGFKDESSIATWAKNYIATAAKYGIVTAMPNGNFDPASSLSRAQAATFISRAMGELYNKAGSYTGSELSGNVTINTPGVTLENTTIEGNLYLT